MTIRVLQGDCRSVLADMPADSFDAVLTDPPYGLEFMGVGWDTFAAPKGRSRSRSRNEWGDFGSREHARAAPEVGRIARNKNVAFQTWTEEWARAALRVLKPGGHMLCFGGTRTQHRMVCAIEDAGFEIRDTVLWVYGSGFPKSLDVSKAIDRAAGAVREVVGVAGRSGSQRSCMAGDFAGGDYMASAPTTPEAAQWAGWGTALKPAVEMICLARKPLSERTVAANVLRWGCGGLNIDGCRIGTMRGVPASHSTTPGTIGVIGIGSNRLESEFDPNMGRWPANLCHDGSPEVLAAFAAVGEKRSPEPYIRGAGTKTASETVYGEYGHRNGQVNASYGDTGSAARFFFSAKADAADRADSRHPTIKPVSLLRWLVRLITPPGGHVLDPFAGSGTTCEAAMLEGFEATLIEQDATHVADIQHRIDRWSGADAPLFRERPSDNAA